jgi:hypothetical protein
MRALHLGINPATAPGFWFLALPSRCSGECTGQGLLFEIK